MANQTRNELLARILAAVQGVPATPAAADVSYNPPADVNSTNVQDGLDEAFSRDGNKLKAEDHKFELLRDVINFAPGTLPYVDSDGLVKCAPLDSQPADSDLVLTKGSAQFTIQGASADVAFATAGPTGLFQYVSPGEIELLADVASLNLGVNLPYNLANVNVTFPIAASTVEVHKNGSPTGSTLTIPGGNSTSSDTVTELFEGLTGVTGDRFKLALTAGASSNPTAGVSIQQGALFGATDADQLPDLRIPGEYIAARVQNNEITPPTFGWTSTAIQDPPGAGHANRIKVSFGSGTAVSSGGEFSFDATRQILTANSPSAGIQYRFDVVLRIGRTGSSGESIIMGRFMYAADGTEANGVQVGNTFEVKIDDDDTTWRETFRADFMPTPGGILWFELARDEDGNNSGGLRAEQPTGSLSANGWNPVATSELRIYETVVV